MFKNNEQDQYMLMDLFLLPHQMLPEHWHLKTEKNPAKREGWLVRCGESHIVGIGEDNLSKDVVIPACHNGGKTETRHEVLAKPGMFVPLAQVESKHWQWAGDEGAIITEVANVHDDSGVRHTDKEGNDFFLSAAPPPPTPTECRWSAASPQSARRNRPAVPKICRAAPPVRRRR